MLLVAQALLLELEFTRLLDKLARRAAARGAQVSASSTLDVVAPTDRAAVEHLCKVYINKQSPHAD